MKKTRKELSKQKQVLKTKEKNAVYQAKYRKKLKEKLKTISTSSSAIGLRSEAGRPSLEESQEGLLDAIKAAAIYGSAAQEAGFTISRSSLYTRLIPKNSRSGQGSRHVVTVPVKLSKSSNDLTNNISMKSFALLL